MTDEFNDLDLNKEIADMEADEAKKTLSEFMEKHEKNRTAYDELHTELGEVETEYQEKLEDREELITEFTEERAEEAAEYVNIPAELVADRFSLEEIDQIIEEGAEFSEQEGEDPEDEPEDDTITSFANRPEKGQGGSNGGSEGDRDRARNLLQRNGFTSKGGNR